jgi:CRISPR-associated protein Csm4
MDAMHLRLRPGSAFGGPIKGDTLFGQLCWAARNRWGESRLAELLVGYTQGQPFAVCSDAFPVGHLPRPALPLHRYKPLAETDRKAVKRRRWVPLAALDRPVEEWLGHCRSDAEVAADLGGESGRLVEVHAQHHNSIHRLTGTTGGAEFAPYTQEQHWFAAGIDLHVYMLVDPSRLAAADAALLLTDVGRIGYGRDASIGLGKFDLVGAPETSPLPTRATANACFTLAPCAPQGLGFSAAASHYELFTRFGRHGDVAVHTGHPFKAPVLLAQTGAVLARSELPAEPFLGQGLGGDGSLSKAPGFEGTVQQGYAPWVGLNIKEGS